MELSHTESVGYIIWRHALRAGYVRPVSTGDFLRAGYAPVESGLYSFLRHASIFALLRRDRLRAFVFMGDFVVVFWNKRG